MAPGDLLVAESDRSAVELSESSGDRLEVAGEGELAFVAAIGLAKQRGRRLLERGHLLGRAGRAQPMVEGVGGCQPMGPQLTQQERETRVVRESR